MLILLCACGCVCVCVCVCVELATPPLFVCLLCQQSREPIDGYAPFEIQKQSMGHDTFIFHRIGFSATFDPKVDPLPEEDPIPLIPASLPANPPSPLHPQPSRALINIQLGSDGCNNPIIRLPVSMPANDSSDTFVCGRQEDGRMGGGGGGGGRACNKSSLPVNSVMEF